MDIAFDGSEFCLQENRPLRLRRARGLRVRCTAGCLWITAVGMREDIFLSAGDSWTLDSHRLVLVESLGAGRARLELPASDTLPRKIGFCRQALTSLLKPRLSPG